MALPLVGGVVLVSGCGGTDSSSATTSDATSREARAQAAGAVPLTIENNLGVPVQVKELGHSGYWGLAPGPGFPTGPTGTVEPNGSVVVQLRPVTSDCIRVGGSPKIGASVRIDLNAGADDTLAVPFSLGVTRAESRCIARKVRSWSYSGHAWNAPTASPWVRSLGYADTSSTTNVATVTARQGRVTIDPASTPVATGGSSTSQPVTLTNNLPVPVAVREIAHTGYWVQEPGPEFPSGPTGILEPGQSVTVPFRPVTYYCARGTNAAKIGASVKMEFSTGAGEPAVFNYPLDVGRRKSECAGTGVRGYTYTGYAWKPSVGVLQSMHYSDRGSSVDKVATATAKVTSITISPQTG